MSVYCPTCYTRKHYCRACKTAHCSCSWARCPSENPADDPKADLEKMR